MSKKIVLLIILCGYFCMHNGILAAPNDSSVIKIKKCPDFVVSGNGNSIYWLSTQWINITRQPPAFNTYWTKAKVLYSETGIYFLFDCEDKKLTSTLDSDN